jgi:hypothetical protein
MAELKIPTETISLPSKGLLYSETSPLSKGQIEMKYMTAKEEDILTNNNFIRQGTVIDKLLQALIVTPIEYNELLVGDKNAILVAARVLGYGKDYTFKYANQRNQEVETTVDLSLLEDKQIDESLFKRGVNEFTFALPHSGNNITFKLLTHGDEQKIDAEIKGLQKVNPNSSTDVTTRLKYIITSVEGKREAKDIREFVDNYLIAKDARALREYYSKISPDIDLTFKPEDESYTGEGITIPVSINFFWPDSGV